MKLPLKEYIKLLSKYLKAQKGSVLLLALILASSVALQLLNPQIIRYFLDAAVNGATARGLTIAALIFIAVAILQQGLNIVATYISQNVGWAATNGLRIDLIEHCIGLDMDFHKAHRPGELIERVDGDISALFNFFSKFMLNILNNVVLLIGILILLLREHWLVGLSLILFTVFAMYVLWYMQSKKVDSWVGEREANAKLFGFIGEQITSTEDIQSCGAKGYTMKKLYKILKAMVPIKIKAVMNYYNMWSATLLIFTVGSVIAFGLSAYLWKKALITIGTVYLIFDYTELLARPIEQIRKQLQDLQKAGASIKRVKELYNTKSKLEEGNEVLNSQGPLEVKLKSVSFEYEKDNQVLRNLSLEVPKGAVLGVLGHTGSGKTTLARLLVRLYDVTGGNIYLDGKSLSTLKFEELKKQIAYVTQDVQLFQASIRDNLTMFNRSIKDEEILKALSEVGLWDWYKSLSSGLDTILDAGGGGLSAGEAQLLAFVRVFLKNPKLVILDEATSRLDPITEQLIEKALDKLLKDRTAIIIAHRLWTVQRADHILIIENGTSIEYGVREELVKDKESRFYKLLQKGIEEVLV